MLFHQDKQKSLFLHDVGVGKTWISLVSALISDKKRVLIVCPNSAVYTWTEQIETHTNEDYTILHHYDKDKRKELLQSNTRFLILNYEGLQTLFSFRRPVLDETGKEIEKERLPSIHTILKQNFDMLIIDESHNVKNKDAFQTLCLREIAKSVPEIIMLTATPTSKSLLDLWAQLWILDGGATLGHNYWHFRSKYFKKSDFNWRIKKGSEEKIFKLLDNRCLRYSRSECLDIPRESYQTRRVKLSTEQETKLQACIKDYQSRIASGEINAGNVMKKTMNIARILNGFEKDEDGKIKYLKSNPKMDALIDWIFECGEEQIIVYHTFIIEGRMIEKVLKKNNITFSSVRGEIKDKTSQLNAFREGKTQVLVAHPKSGGESLNLQMGSVLFFYSILRLGIIKRKQCIGRIVRNGQTKHCLIGDIIIEDSEDELNLLNLEDDAKLAERLLKYIQNKKIS